MATPESAVPPCLCLRLRVTVLVENTSRRADTLAEHGFAVYMETERGVILFDTGATAEALAANARALGMDLGRVSAIVLSHGHYDHTGGLASAVAQCRRHGCIFIGGRRPSGGPGGSGSESPSGCPTRADGRSTEPIANRWQAPWSCRRGCS